MFFRAISPRLGKMLTFENDGKSPLVVPCCSGFAHNFPQMAHELGYIPYTCPMFGQSHSYYLKYQL